MLEQYGQVRIFSSHYIQNVYYGGVGMSDWSIHEAMRPPSKFFEITIQLPHIKNEIGKIWM